MIMLKKEYRKVEKVMKKKVISEVDEKITKKSIVTDYCVEIKFATVAIFFLVELTWDNF